MSPHRLAIRLYVYITCSLSCQFLHKKSPPNGIGEPIDTLSFRSVYLWHLGFPQGPQVVPGQAPQPAKVSCLAFFYSFFDKRTCFPKLNFASSWIKDCVLFHPLFSGLSPALPPYLL